MRSNCFALKYSLSFIFPQRSLQRSFTSHAKLNYMLGVSNATEWTQMTTHLKNFSTLISMTELWTVETEVMEYETDSESGQAGKGKVKSFANLPNLSLLGKQCNKKREKLHINKLLLNSKVLHLCELIHYYLHPREHYNHLLL